jgi:hypothetical protein
MKGQDYEIGAFFRKLFYGNAGTFSLDDF